MADVPGDASCLQDSRYPISSIVNKDVGVKQGYLHFLFTIAPLAHYFLDGKKNFEAPA